MEDQYLCKWCQGEANFGEEFNMGSMFCDRACQEDCYHFEAGLVPNLLRGKSSSDYRIEKVPVINNKPPGSQEVGHINVLSPKRRSMTNGPPGDRHSVVLTDEKKFQYAVSILVDDRNITIDNATVPIYRDYDPDSNKLVIGYTLASPITGDVIKRGVTISFTNLYNLILSGFYFKGDLSTVLSKGDVAFITKNNTESAYIKLVKRKTSPRHPELIIELRYSSLSGYYMRALFLRYDYDILKGHLTK